MSGAATTVSGTILVRGGPNGGNGGLVETSSGGTLSIASSATVDASAPHGTAGLWYLDPTNIIIDNGGSDLGTGGTTTGGDTFTNNSGGTDTITATSIKNSLNGGTNVTLQAINDLTLDAGSPITATAGAGNLTLQAGKSIAINDNITLKGSFTAKANDAAGVSGATADETQRGSKPGSFTMASGTTIDTSAGAASSITISVGTATTVNATPFPVGPITLAGLKTGTSGNLVVSVGSGASTAANGSISQTSDQVTIGGTSSFTTSTTGATINLSTSTNALTGAVRLNTTGAGANASLTNNVAVGTSLAANTGIGGNLTVINTLGNLSQTGALTVTGTSSFTDSAATGTITLTQANALTGAVTLGTNGAGANASLKNTFPTTLAASTVGGDLTVTTTGAASNLTVGGTINAPHVALTSSAGISQTIGHIAGQLAVNSVGSVALTGPNSVTDLAAKITGAGSSFQFRDDATALKLDAVTVNAATTTGITTNKGQIQVATTTSGTITVTNAIGSGGGEIDLAAAPGSGIVNQTVAITSGGGNIVLLGDSIALGGGAGTGTVNAGTGTVVLGPATVADDIVLGAASSGGTLGLRTVDFATITAGQVQIGYRNEDGSTTGSFSGNISIGGAAGVQFAFAQIPSVVLVTGASGTVTQTEPITFDTANKGTLGIISGGAVTLSWPPIRSARSPGSPMARVRPSRSPTARRLPSARRRRATWHQGRRHDRGLPVRRQ